MPRMGFAIEDQRSSSSFRFEEGRGLITDAEVAQGTGEFNSLKCVARLTIQRVGKDGKPTEDEPVIEDLTVGPLTKFHPGNAASDKDEDPEDLGDEGSGNCIFANEGAHPDPKAKASIFGKSLQENGVRPQLLNGYMPNLIGLDADFARQVVKYDGLDKDASNLVIKKDGHIYNLSEINKRVGGGDSKPVSKPNATSGKTAPKSAAATGGKTNGAANTSAGSGSGGGDDEDKAKEYAAAIVDVLLVQTDEIQVIERGKIASKAITQLAKKQVPPKFHKPVQALIGKDDWFVEYVEGKGFGVDGTEVTIPAQ